ncbi:hypothetical protein MRX96_007545 [Rhipicephalus microplus]
MMYRRRTLPHKRGSRVARPEGTEEKSGATRRRAVLQSRLLLRGGSWSGYGLDGSLIVIALKSTVLGAVQRDARSRVSAGRPAECRRSREQALHFTVASWRACHSRRMAARSQASTQVETAAMYAPRLPYSGVFGGSHVLYAFGKTTRLISA